MGKRNDTADSGATATVRPRKRWARRSVTVVILGGLVAVVASKEIRSKLLDLLFGSEEEFTYSSTTAPPTPAPTASTPA